MATTNNCQGTVHTTQCEHSSAPALKKRDCEKVRTDVRDAEKSMGWLQWIATKDDSWRDPWVIFAKFNECKRLPEQLDAGAYTQLRDRLQAYDRGELKLSGEDAMELRRTVNLVQMRYDNVPNPYETMPSNYISPAEQEVYDRFGNNMTMAVMPATIPGIAGTRAMGGTEAQASAGGQLSAMAFGFMGARFMQKHGLLRSAPKSQAAPRETANGAPLEPRSQPASQTKVVKNGFAVNLIGPKPRRLSKDEHREWLEKNGYRNVDDHVKSADPNKPVEMVQINKGEEITMYVRDGGKPGSYATLPGTSAERLAIEPQGRHTETFFANEPFQVIRSTAGEFPTGIYKGVGGPGGGIQYQLPQGYEQYVTKK